MRNNGVSENHIESKREETGSSKVGPFLLGAVLGAVVGGALALIYAPAEGTELRKKMSRTFEDIADGVGGIIETAKTASDKIFNEGRDKADEVIDRTREKVDDILDGADRAIAEARKRTTSRDEG